MNLEQIRDDLSKARISIAMATELHDMGIHDHQLLSLALADLKKVEAGLKGVRPRYAGGQDASQRSRPITKPSATPEPSESISAAR